MSGPHASLRRLETLGRRRAETEVAIAAVVGTARQAGASWSAVGAALGVSPQAAQHRYGPKPDRRARVRQAAPARADPKRAKQQGALRHTADQARLMTPSRRATAAHRAQTRKGKRS